MAAYAVDTCTIIDGAERWTTADTVESDLDAMHRAKELLTTPGTVVVKVNVWLVDDDGEAINYVDGYTADDFPKG